MNVLFSSGDGDRSVLTNSLQIRVVGRRVTAPHTPEELLTAEQP